MESNSKNQNPVFAAATAAGVAGGGVLLAPLAPLAAPALHGIAGVAVVGIGVYATGSAVMNVTRFVSQQASGMFNDGAMVVELLKGTVFSSRKPKVPAKEVPFRRQ